MQIYHPIGVFDSGYGGLTILSKIREVLPEYDYIYLGDNARSPYGVRSFEVVYEFTLQAVKALFAKGCNLVILACNTASAKALRSIQQKDLSGMGSNKRVLGVIRPTVETIDTLTKTKHIGVLGTVGTISSESYPIEIHKLFPEIIVNSQSCPMWVPLIEYGEAQHPGADYFIKKYIKKILDKDPKIDTLVLGCTHYPLIENKIKEFLPSKNIRILSQGHYVANSLKDYLQRHPEMDTNCSKEGSCLYYTTEEEYKFSEMASVFLKDEVKAKRISLN